MTTTLNTVNTQTQNVEGKGAIAMNNLTVAIKFEGKLYPVTNKAVLDAHIQHAGAESLKGVKNIHSRGINNMHFALVSQAIAKKEKLTGVSVVDIWSNEDALIVINSVEDYEAFKALVRSLGCRKLTKEARKRLVNAGKHIIIVTDKGQKALKTTDQTDFYVSKNAIGGTIELLGYVKGEPAYVINNERSLDSTIMSIAGTVKRAMKKREKAERKLKQTDIFQIFYNDIAYDFDRDVFVVTRALRTKVSSSVLLERVMENGCELVSFDMNPESHMKQGAAHTTFVEAKGNIVMLKDILAVDPKTGKPVMPKGAVLGKDNKDRREARRKIFLKALLMLGLEVNGKLFFPVVQTASQGRTGSVWISNFANKEEVEAFRQCLTYGAFGRVFAGEVKEVMAKIEARLGLNGSTSKSIGFNVTVKRVDDFEREVAHKAKALDNNENYVDGSGSNYYKIVDKIETILNVTDGCGMGSVEFFVEKAVELGCISQAECDYFFAHYTTLAALRTTENARLMRIFKKVPNAVMLRGGSNYKGLVFMWDLKAEGVKEDVMLPTSMCKEMKGDIVRGVEWRICLVNRSKWAKARLSNQIMGALNLNREELKSLLDENLSAFTVNVLNNYNEALKLAGVLSDMNGESSAATMVAQALAANRFALTDPWVRQQLIKMTKSAILGFKYGELYIEGANYFVIPDPKVYFRNKYADAELLQSGEVYCNNLKGLIAGLRSPHCHISEAMLTNAVKNNDYWHLTNLLIINSFDNIAPAAQGMDFDGDRMLVTMDWRIVSAVKRNKSRVDYYVLQGLPGSARKVDYTPEAVADLYVTRSVRDMVGQISNIAAHQIDLYNHFAQLVAQIKPMIEAGTATEKHIALYNYALMDMPRLEEAHIKLSCMIGGAVDYAKTGINPSIGKEVATTHMPKHFLMQKIEREGESRSYDELVAEQTEKGIQVYESRSGLGYCYKYVTGFMEQFMASLESESAKTKSQQFAASLLLRFTQEEVAAVEGDVVRILKSYGNAMASLSRMKDNSSVSEEEMNDQFALVIDQYRALMASVHENQALVAAVCYGSVHDTKMSGSIYAPWGLCFEGMITLLGEGYHNASILLPSYVTPEDSVYVAGGMLYINGIMTQATSLPVGPYQVTETAGRCYIMARVKGDVINTAKEKDSHFHATGDVFMVKALGFKYNASKDAQGFMNMLANNNWEFEIKENVDGRVMIFVDGFTPIAAYQTEKGANLITARQFTNKRCRLVNPLTSSTHANGIYYVAANGEVKMRQAVELVFEVMGEAASLFAGQVEAVEYLERRRDYNPAEYGFEVGMMDATFEAVSFSDEEAALVALYERELEREHMYC